MLKKIDLLHFSEGSTGEDAQSGTSALPQPPEEDSAGRETAPDGSGEESAGKKNAEQTEPEAGEEKERSGEVPELEKRSDALLEDLRSSFLRRLKRAAGESVIAGWEREEQELKKIYPDFELKKEFSGNRDFTALVKAGLPLRKAYEAANIEKILSSALRYAAVRGGQKTAASMSGGPARPQENSVLDRASSLKTTDVNSLTQKDIMRIIGEVNRGAKITFR